MASISDINKISVTVNLLESIDQNAESSIQIDLYQGLPKSSKMDYIVQKATEIGVNTIIPIITERVIVKSDLGEFKKTERWKE